MSIRYMQRDALEPSSIDWTVGYNAFTHEQIVQSPFRTHWHQW